MTPSTQSLLNPDQTAACLPYTRLLNELTALLSDSSVTVPPRQVLALPGGGSLFVMPAHDARTAITKLITFTPANNGKGLATIQGNVMVFDVATGQHMLMMDGPTVTARRTAAVSLLAAQRLAPNTQGPLLIVGAGVQGKAHLDAFAEGLQLTECMIASRTLASAQSLAMHAESLGLRVRVLTDASAALADCPLVVTCTPANAVVLAGRPRDDAFVAAVGAFTPHMVELSPELCRHVAACGTVVLDTPDARHEAGDLLQAGLDVAAFPSLADVLCTKPLRAKGVTSPVLFKSCGWAGWDLAAARTARHELNKGR